MSVSDLMTGLMVIFLFVAIAYIKRVQNAQTILKDFVENKQELHDKLINKFKSEIDDGVVVIGGDLSMRFQRAETLFDNGSWALKPDFKEHLERILPKYFNVLLNDSLKWRIREIRIEGHTDDTPYPSLNPDPYIANLILSQRRAVSVIQFLRSLPDFQQYAEEDKKLLEYWFTANGLSFGHALDECGEDAFVSGNNIDRDHSRRVEFRIITSGEEILEKVVEESNHIL